MKRLLLLPVLIATVASAQTLKTRWADRVTPENVWREYPRPQMVRKDWVNLNGMWTCSIQRDGRSAADAPSYQVLVPFPIESQLSRVHQSVGPKDTVVYRRTFTRPKGERVILHFGAVDWKSRVWVNGKEVGSHTGGYDAFSFDITSALNPSGEQDLVVSVTDPTDTNWQPRGKQVLKPGGIFYTPCTGIWQTVWMEGVSETYIDNLKIETWPRASQVNVTVDAKGFGPGKIVNIEAVSNGKVVARTNGALKYHENLPEDPGRAPIATTFTMKIANHVNWSPDNPFLYDLRVTLTDAPTGKKVDQIGSYFGFRELTLSKEAQPRLLLNGKPIFLIGPLDQGFWPDGIYTPPSDAAMKYDLDVTKRLGFNMIRKHVKVEPARWYYWCDKLGICVLQDLPSGDRSIGPNDPDIQRTPESGENLKNELRAMVNGHFNSPSIVSWVLYNEGWGQWDTAAMTKFLRDLDPTRPIDSVTGWADRAGVGDFSDWHVYPGPGAPPNESGRVIFLGEFGGLGLPVPGHMWQEKGWGYQSFKTSEELTDKFVELFYDLRLLQAKGLSGAVYTQTTDVETELNGLMTYDRAMLKMDEKKVKKAVTDLLLPPPTMTTVVPTAEDTGADWRYSTTPPGMGWYEAAFNDSSWKTGPGGFGTEGTPGAIVRTNWNGKDIFLRRKFRLNRDYKPGELMLRVSYDDDVVVYIDGQQVYKSPGWTTSYKLVPLNRMALKAGEHTLAIYCHQNTGGQYIDAGLVQVSEGK